LIHPFRIFAGTARKKIDHMVKKGHAVTAKKKDSRKKPVAAKPKSSPAKVAKDPPAVDADRAEAAAEVLQAVWLHEKHFDLENEIAQKDGHPIVDQDAEGHLWVTVRLHVPALDVDTWLDGSHLDHPDNQPDEADEDDA